MDDPRTGRNIQHSLSALLRQSVYSRLAGYEDVNDAERLAVDPTMRAKTGRLKSDRNSASTNTMGCFETEILAGVKNLEALTELNGLWLSKAMKLTDYKTLIIDMDSSESPVHGKQEGSAYNGHFKSNCYHPLFCFNQFGDCEGALLRPGNVHSSNQARLALFVLAYNLGNFLRRFTLPKSIRKWSMRTLLTKLIKIGAKIVKHGRYRVFQMAEVVMSSGRFQPETTCAKGACCA